MTGPAARLTAPASWLHLPRPTARLRLTLLYGGLFTLAGAALLGFTYWLFDRATAGKQIVPKPGPGSRVACLLKDPNCIKIVGGWQAQPAHDLHTLLAQSGIALAIMAALAFALGWLVAGRVLRPVRTITATARAISATSLHERLTLTGPDDEFKELAAALNGLLARLEASFTAQRHFVASASHELRTPLILDRTLLQVALRNPRTSIEQWRTTGQELLESGQQQERLLEALLTLATSEGGISNREPADLSKAAIASLHATGSAAERQAAPRANLTEPRTRTRRPPPDRTAGRQPARQRRPPQHQGRHSPAQHRPAGRPRRHLRGQHRPGHPARRGHPAVPALRTPGHPPRQQRQRTRPRPVHRRRHRRRPRRQNRRPRPS
jgi:signal transduction histidine kinase